MARILEDEVERLKRERGPDESMSRIIVSVFALGLLPSSLHADAAPVHVNVLDQTEAAFPNVLVIIKSLDRKTEVSRALTDARGGVPQQEVAPGMYRIIATCPYGICETKVKEILVRDAPVQLQMTVDVAPTRGNTFQTGPARTLKVEVSDNQGRPANRAEVLVRDAEARNERWYRTASDGTVSVDLPDGPVTVVVLYAGTLTSKTLSQATVNELLRSGAPVRDPPAVARSASRRLAVEPANTSSTRRPAPCLVG